MLYIRRDKKLSLKQKFLTVDPAGGVRSTPPLLDDARPSTGTGSLPPPPRDFLAKDAHCRVSKHDNVVTKHILRIYIRYIYEVYTNTT